MFRGTKKIARALAAIDKIVAKLERGIEHVEAHEEDIRGKLLSVYARVRARIAAAHARLNRERDAAHVQTVAAELVHNEQAAHLTEHKARAQRVIERLKALTA